MNIDGAGFLRSVQLKRDEVEDFGQYPFSIPAVRALETLEFHPKVTFLIGENGAGKSTLVEAIAMAAGLNPEGGSRNLRFENNRTESVLHRYLRSVRNPGQAKRAFFYRAENFFNVATEIENLPGNSLAPYGGTSLHEQSHGESFLSLITHQFGANGLYILDEPEAALSPQNRLSLLARIDDLVNQGCQFIIATHSPIVMAYPEAVLYQIDDDGIGEVAYEDTEHFALTREFLNHRERFFRHLFE